MAMPPEVKVGVHRLVPLSTCRDADVQSGIRRCSDSLLTAFCFVGELQLSSEDETSQEVEASCDDGIPCVLWYYSPLFQYVRKRILVEESVAEAAITSALAAQRGRAGALDTPCQNSSGTTGSPTSSSASENEDELEHTTTTTAAAVAMPTVYLRIGSSLTFREYGLATWELPSSVETPVSEETLTRLEMNESAEAAAPPPVEHTPPVLLPLTPKRPTLKPTDTRIHEGLLRMTLRRSARRSVGLCKSESPSAEAPRHGSFLIQHSTLTFDRLPSEERAATTQPLAASSHHLGGDALVRPYSEAFPLPAPLGHNECPSFPNASREVCSSLHTSESHRGSPEDSSSEYHISPSRHLNNIDGLSLSSEPLYNSEELSSSALAATHSAILPARYSVINSLPAPYFSVEVSGRSLHEAPVPGADVIRIGSPRSASTPRLSPSPPPSRDKAKTRPAHRSPQDAVGYSCGVEQ